MATSVPIVVFLGLSVFKLGPMYATDRRQTDRRQTKTSLNASALWGQRHNNVNLTATSEANICFPIVFNFLI